MDGVWIYSAGTRAMIYAHEIGERVIPVGQAWHLAEWYLQPSPPLVVVEIKVEELPARLLLGAIVCALAWFVSVVGAMA
jgi:hypothetical protein